MPHWIQGYNNYYHSNLRYRSHTKNANLKAQFHIGLNTHSAIKYSGFFKANVRIRRQNIRKQIERKRKLIRF